MSHSLLYRIVNVNGACVPCPNPIPDMEDSAVYRRGRPRDLSIDEVILRVALDQMSIEGYGGMSMDRVAAMAGVTKPTLYRRWKSKADLATAALAQLQAREPVPDTGSARSDLISLLRGFQRSLLRPNGMAMIGTLLAEEHRTPELIALFRDRIVRPRREMIQHILVSARREGAVHPDADLEAAGNLLVGSFYARYLVGDMVPPEWPERIVAVVWEGIGA